MTLLRISFATVLVLMAISSLRADDAGIPMRCRPKEAMDDPKCADILDARFKERNLRLNVQDRAANAELKAHILATRTRSGDTIADTLSYAAKRIPFVVNGWRFVYARSGSEYVVLEYNNKPVNRSNDDELEALSFFDYDLEADPLFSLQNSFATDFVVWKVSGTDFIPWGEYANMLALSPPAFVYAVNHGRKGFEDSGYDDALHRDFSFLAKLDADTGKLSDYVDPSSPGLEMYWNVVDGYVVKSDDGVCPPKKVGLFTIRGPNCEIRAAAARDISGKVLPFKVIRAIRNHGYVDKMVEAYVSISVDGGTPGDWMATAVYVAQHSIVRDVTFSKVDVLVANPWADFPPLHSKWLAEVYYAPNPSRSPWKEQWSIFSADRAGTLADIEFDKLSDELIDETPDPDLRQKKADTAAKKIVVQKYSLPKDWQSARDLGLNGQYHDHDHIHISPVSGIDASISALMDCLNTDKGNALITGCVPPRQ